MRKKYNVKIKPNVKSDLDKHVCFATNVSNKFAKSIRDSFYKVLKEQLPYNSDCYPLWLPDFELPKPYRKILIKKRYQILFYIEKDQVFVDYLLDCRMDNSKLF